MAKNLDVSNFDETIKEGVTLVDFWAPWCGPCQAMGPAIEELSSSFEGKATISKVDVDENQDIAMRFGIMSIPTIVIFKDGEIVFSETGVKTAEDLKNEVEKYL